MREERERERERERGRENKDTCYCDLDTYILIFSDDIEVMIVNIENFAPIGMEPPQHELRSLPSLEINNKGVSAGV